MRRKTQRAPKGKKTAFHTIPEIRRAFDYIDEFVHLRLASGIPKEQLVKEVQREWLRVFSKRLEKKNATAFVEHHMELAPRRRGLRATRKQGKQLKGQRGGVAPLDYTTQQGAYLASGLPPTPGGHYPLANGGASAYGSMTTYIGKGFTVPEIAAKGQYESPSPGQGMGSNRIQSGGRSIRAKRRGAPMEGGSLVGSLLTQAFTRPFQSTVPISHGQAAQTSWYGGLPGTSSNLPQNQPSYRMGDVIPGRPNIRIDV